MPVRRLRQRGHRLDPAEEVRLLRHKAGDPLAEQRLGRVHRRQAAPSFRQVRADLDHADPRTGAVGLKDPAHLWIRGG